MLGLIRREVLQRSASGTEAAAALIISLAVIEGIILALALFVFRPGAGGAADESQNAKEVVRLKLGRWLALALEFELAADLTDRCGADMERDWPVGGHRCPFEPRSIISYNAR